MRCGRLVEEIGKGRRKFILKFENVDKKGIYAGNKIVASDESSWRQRYAVSNGNATWSIVIVYSQCLEQTFPILAMLLK